MGKEEETSSLPKPTKLINVKIIDGSQADVYEIGRALQVLLKDHEDELPFKLQAIITTDRIELRDIDALIRELWKLKKQIDKEKN